MAAKNVMDVAELLLRYSRKPDTAMAIIEQATTVHQQVHITTLKNCKLDFIGNQFSSPSLVIVGDVVKLHQSFNCLHRIYREELLPQPPQPPLDVQV